MLYRAAVTLCLFGMLYAGLWVMIEWTMEDTP